jgi:hypothetical protein
MTKMNFLSMTLWDEGASGSRAAEMAVTGAPPSALVIAWFVSAEILLAA